MEDLVAGMNQPALWMKHASGMRQCGARYRACTETERRRRGSATLLTSVNPKFTGVSERDNSTHSCPIRAPFLNAEVIMINSRAIKIIAVCAGFTWATSSFSQLFVKNKSVAPSLAAAVPVPAVGFSLVAAASEPVKVTGGWVRSTVSGQKGSGAFMKITAREGTRLVGVSSPVAGVAEVHEMKMDGDVMKMRGVPVLELPAGSTVELKPGGYHLMLMDWKQTRTVGSTVPVTLMFRDGKGTERRVEVKLPVAAAAPDAGAAKTGITGQTEK